jgi:putrescine aminotransferase
MNHIRLPEQGIENILHPWTDLSSLSAAALMIIESGDGYHVTDSHGKRYLYGIGGMWCMTIGYAREEMAQAMHEQVMKIPYYTPFAP